MIEVVEETASTNADLVRRLGAGEHIQEAYWLRAVRQNAGRGRRGREWIAPEGNLACSTVVNLRADDPAAHSLAFVAALAVHDVLVGELAPESTKSSSTPLAAGAAPVSCDKLRTSGQGGKDGAEGRCMLKWPNDVLVDGAKISGILLERVGNQVVAGIGINIENAPDVPGRMTTSLHAAGISSDAGDVLKRLAPHFSARLLQWRTEGLGVVLAEWQQRASPPGTALLIALDDEGILAGTFAGLAPDGALRLRLVDGSLRVIHAGDVSLL